MKNCPAQYGDPFCKLASPLIASLRLLISDLGSAVIFFVYPLRFVSSHTTTQQGCVLTYVSVRLSVAYEIDVMPLKVYRDIKLLNKHVSAVCLVNWFRWSRPVLCAMLRLTSHSCTPHLCKCECVFIKRQSSHLKA